jgi:hypothetical protein
MAGTPTFGALTNPADFRKINVQMMDNSGDTWIETLYVAISATYTAINAWVVLYQLVTQATVFSVDEVNTWAGDADPDFTDTDMRSGVENGINLNIKNAGTRELRPLRVVAPIPAALQGSQDIPLLSSTALSNLIVATLALQTGFNLQSAQYTTRRERKNNPKVQ